jgi:hypothetical protein
MNHNCVQKQDLAEYLSNSMRHIHIEDAKVVVKVYHNIKLRIRKTIEIEKYLEQG